MKKRLAVVLLRIAGVPDQPTRFYVESLFTNTGRGTQNLVDYFEDMSHGILDIGDSQVFDWIDYGHTEAEVAEVRKKAYDEKYEERVKADDSEAAAAIAAGKHANSAMRDQIVEWGKEAAAKNHYDIAGYDLYVWIFNQLIDYFGYPGTTVLSWNDTYSHQKLSIELTGVAHEVGHGLGLSHSRMVGAGPSEDYGDRWDIMSAFNIWYDNAGTSTYYTAGPGLNAANMDLAGWFDQSRLFTGNGSDSALLRLRPLHRRDLPGWLGARLQFGYELFYIEFRVKERWDANIPESAVFLHRRAIHPESGRPCSELFITNPAKRQAALLQGETLELGDASDPFGSYARITVTHLDTDNQEAWLNIYIRQRRRIEPQGIPSGGVTGDGGGLVWTPRRGFVRVPPRSPLLRLLETVADFETLQEVIAGEHINTIDQLSMDQLTKARQHLTEIIEAREVSCVPYVSRR